MKGFSNPFAKNEAVGQQEVKPVKVLAPAEFLTKSSGGYFNDGDSFLTWGESLRDTDAAELSNAFHFMNMKMRCIKESETKTDKGGRPYRYYTFLRSSKSQPGVKILMEGPMAQIMSDYQDNLLETTFELNELIAAAKEM